LEKAKIHPLILLALCFSSISMAMYAYRNFANQEVGNSVVLTVLFIFFVGLVISGLIRNKKIKNESER
jgi:lipopolysaccharide export LptBFGC system permease protein LptF